MTHLVLLTAEVVQRFADQGAPHPLGVAVLHLPQETTTTTTRAVVYLRRSVGLDVL